MEATFADDGTFEGVLCAARGGVGRTGPAPAVRRLRPDGSRPGRDLHRGHLSACRAREHPAGPELRDVPGAVPGRDRTSAALPRVPAPAGRRARLLPSAAVGADLQGGAVHPGRVGLLRELLRAQRHLQPPGPGRRDRPAAPRPAPLLGHRRRLGPGARGGGARCPRHEGVLGGPGHLAVRHRQRLVAAYVRASAVPGGAADLARLDAQADRARPAEGPARQAPSADDRAGQMGPAALAEPAQHRHLPHGVRLGRTHPGGGLSPRRRTDHRATARRSAPASVSGRIRRRSSTPRPGGTVSPRW